MNTQIYTQRRICIHIYKHIHTDVRKYIYRIDERERDQKLGKLREVQVSKDKRQNCEKIRKIR